MGTMSTQDHREAFSESVVAKWREVLDEAERDADFRKRVFAARDAYQFETKAGGRKFSLFLLLLHLCGFRRAIADEIDRVQRERAETDARILERFERLENELTELKAQQTLKYLGVFDPEVEYQPGEFVTQSGSVWHCRSRTTTRPGKSADWQLAVKRGADGMDAR